LFLLESPTILFNNYLQILISPSILATDYLAIAGLAATLFNVITIVYFNILIVYLMGHKMNGHLIGAILTVIGFVSAVFVSFFECIKVRFSNIK